MAQRSKLSFWKELKYLIILILILGFLFEMIASMIFFRKYATGNLAIMNLAERFRNRSPDLSKYHRMHELVRPDSAPALTRRIADETWEANKYSYEPWLLFKVTDYKSMYVNITGFERKSIPDKFINTASADTLDIFFMGGSTMYGYNVSDAETIPSQFLRIYMQKYPSGKSIRIRNYGVPYYYSKQELILLSKLIFDGNRPDIIIFMDGLNDFYPSRMLYYDRPHFSYAMQQVFDDKMFQKGKRTIVDTSDQFYIDPPGIAPRQYYQQLFEKYLDNVEQATRLSKSAGAKSYFFCQPVPFYNYPNRDNDPISYKVSYDRYDYIYPLIEKKLAALVTWNSWETCSRMRRDCHL